MSEGDSFEELLANPYLQFDLDNELLPHLLSFRPPKSSKPWLYEDVPSGTIAAVPDLPVSGEENKDD